MPRLRVVPAAPPPLPQEERDEELRRIARDLAGLLVTIVGDAYSLRAALPNSPQRRDAVDIEQAGQRAAVLVEQMGALVGIDPPDTRDEWETD